MRCLGGRIAASFLAAWSLVGADLALAADTPDSRRFLLFSGFDLWRNGGFGHGGLLWSPAGLAREGFTFKLLVAGGRYHYQSGGTEITGSQTLAGVLPGWRFKRDALELTLFAGADLQSHRLRPDDPDNRMRGTNFGLRVGGDLWYQPSGTFMMSAGASASTIGPNYWTRAAVGWRLFDAVWVGPEVLALGGDRYHQFRAGVHATALRTLAVEWTAGFGFVRDSDERDGLYTSIGVISRR